MGVKVTSSVKIKGLVRGEESHELWGDINVNYSILGHVEVLPGSGEVSLEPLAQVFLFHLLVSLQYFLGGGFEPGFVHVEFSVGGSIFVFAFQSVVLDH